MSSSFGLHVPPNVLLLLKVDAIFHVVGLELYLLFKTIVLYAGSKKYFLTRRWQHTMHILFKFNDCRTWTTGDLTCSLSMKWATVTR